MTLQNQKTILLVEDEALINVIEKQTLIKHGFNVIVASNGEKAINAVRNTPGIDLILMDINLGKGIDGTEAAEIILKENDIPLLFLSSYTQPEVVERTEKITSYGYVVKDSGETVLLASIKMAFKLYDAHKHLKESEEALKEREKTLQAFFDAVHESMVLINTEGTVLLSNAVGAQRLGKTAQEFIGTSLYKHFPPDVARYRKEHYDKVIATGEPVYFQDIRSGRSFEQHCYPLFNEERKVSGVTIFAHEVTDRKKTEDERQKLQERLHHADKMESIGTLAGGIAHDFNNLLMGIRGYASLMLQDIDSSHPYYKKLTGIEEQVQSGADLTSQLLGFARGGRYEVKPADMNNIIEKTSSMFGRTKKEIVIHGKYGKDLWTVEVDQGQMEQVLLNLYVNAGQAMPGGGELYLETENVLLDDTQTFPYAVTPGRYIKISLTDTGTGIDEKTKERIFDPFFTTKEVGKGTGLGLAMAYGIIKGHGGMINVYSEPNHGTTFTLYLPASDKAAYKETPIVTEILSGSETILLVDDEPTVLEVSKEILEFLGYTVYAMKNGREAIVLYKEMKNDIALIILDMIMPGLSGGETFDRIRELNPLAKIILSSGYSLNREMVNIFQTVPKGF